MQWQSSDLMMEVRSPSSQHSGEVQTKLEGYGGTWSVIIITSQVVPKALSLLGLIIEWLGLFFIVCIR